MTRNRQASGDGDPLLHQAQRLIVEAERLTGTAKPGDPEHKARLAALIDDLGEVHQAMVGKRDALRQETDTVVRQMNAASAYHRAVRTLLNSRKRP